MRRYDLSPLANDDLRSIWSYIGERNSVAADKVIDKFYSVFVSLASQPGMGQTAPYAENLKQFPCGRYVVYFRRLDDNSAMIEIVRVIHGSRNAGTVTFGEPDE
ncbi:MAG: type II toxin-antitoxin system RelE/ParE family toxin [Planctomycetes bacterium]|nr:type II toxin-antitoxin system RelE/ParE family toxin [Planctomycetota bacterium]